MHRVHYKINKCANKTGHLTPSSQIVVKTPLTPPRVSANTTQPLPFQPFKDTNWARLLKYAQYKYFENASSS